MNIELELRFVLEPEQIPRLQRLPVFKTHASCHARTRHMVTVYFDTPDWCLRQSGVSLRVRRIGRQYVQCVKSKADRIAGIRARRELEVDIPTDQPVPAAIDDPDLVRLLDRAGHDRFQPVFQTEIRRTTRHLSFADGGEVTADIDVGEIVTPSGREPVCELELELKAGEPHRLFDLALDIHSALPLRLSTKTKSARGHALLAGTAPESRKSAKPEISRDATVEDALLYTVGHCLNHLLANMACALETEDAGGVHQTRVALRRLRSALWAFRPVLPAAMYRWLTAEIRWLTDQMAMTRDWDVFLGEIVAPVAARFPGEATFQVLRSRLIEERERTRHVAQQAIRSERYTTLVLQLGSWLTHRAWRSQPVTESSAQLFRPVAEIAGNVIAKRHGKVRRKGRRFARMSAAERHRLRIDVKKLRYVTEFFASLYPRKGVKSYSARLANLQDALGYLSDLTVAERLIEEICASCAGDEILQCRHAGGIVIGWHSHALTRCEDRLARDIAAFVKVEPFWS